MVGQVLGRTSIWPRLPRRTICVRTLDAAWRGGLLLLSVFWHVLLAASAQAENIGRPPHQEARGWLQLEQDQRDYRQRVEPLPPRDSATLHLLEQRQQDRTYQLQQQQRRGMDADRRDQRARTAGKRPQSGSPSGIPRDDARQRLDSRLQRETLAPDRP